MENQIVEFFSNQYVRAFLIILAFFLASKIIAYASENYFKKWAQKSKTTLDDLIVEKLKPPFVYIIVLFGLQIAMSQIESNALWLENLVNSILALFLIYAGFIVIDIIFKFWAETFKKRYNSKTIDSLTPLFKKTLLIILSILGMVWILHIWGIDIGPILAGVGIAGFVIGFAMQDSLKNIFGGVALILDKTFGVGERVVLEGGETGIIETVSVRSTKIRTFDNELLTVPNGRLAEMKIRNFSQPDLSLRVVVNFSTAYGSNSDEVRKLITKTLSNIEEAKDDPAPDVIMVEMADSGLSWQGRFWVDDHSIAFSKKIEALDLIYKELNKNGIEIPFPTRTIHIKKED